MPDAYDAQIARLTERPEEIQHAWFRSQGIFDYAHPAREFEYGSGCLTMIRTQDAVVPGRPDLTAEIAQDERIPKNNFDITPAHLPVFAEWQRRLDMELGREAWKGGPENTLRP